MSVWPAFHAFVTLYEEPTLRARHGPQYDAYCSAVRRWWPRRSARRADADGGQQPAP